MKTVSIWRQLSKISRLLLKDANMSLLQVDKKKMQKPFKISVEGNIGSGKTMFLNYFKQFPFIEIYGEPLDKWRNVQGHNLLELQYNDMEKWSSTFQSYVQLTRTQLQCSTPRNGVKIQMFERSVQNNRYCFLENAFKNGVILPAEFSVLVKWFEWIQENVDISLDLIVYLRTSPEVSYQRVLNRNRIEEKKITLSYLKSLQEVHDKWLMDPKMEIPVLIVNADEQFDEIISFCQKKLPVLFNQNISMNFNLLKNF